MGLTTPRVHAVSQNRVAGQTSQGSGAPGPAPAHSKGSDLLPPPCRGPVSCPVSSPSHPPTWFSHSEPGRAHRRGRVTEHWQTALAPIGARVLPLPRSRSTGTGGKQVCEPS